LITSSLAIRERIDRPILGHYRRLAIVIGPTTIAHLCTQTILLHLTITPILAAALTQIAQAKGDLAIAMDAIAFQPGLLDQPKQVLILHLAR